MAATRAGISQLVQELQERKTAGYSFNWLTDRLDQELQEDSQLNM